jgi:uncharacterized protein
MPWRLQLLAAVVFATSFLRAAEVIPPPPPRYCNDFAGIVRPATATQLDRELAQFERDTSNQILVAIYPRLQSSSSVEDYAVRVAQSWRVGQKAKDNGAVLFVFQESHDIRIVTGYGLEGALPDILCKQIIENEIVPKFRAGDFDAGVTAGVHAMMAATRGEYRGTGRIVGQVTGGRGVGMGTIIFFIVIFLIFRAVSRRGVVYSPLGRRNIWINRGPWGGGSGGGWSGGGGGGGFSGGGGRFGGGGAGGKW